MRERNPDMDFQCDLLEDTKEFLDDLLDGQIINISRRFINPNLQAVILTNKHGKTLGFTYMALQEAKRYCQWLIEIGAVKVEAPKAL